MSIRYTFAAAALALLSATAAQAQGERQPLMTVQKLYFKYCMAQSSDYDICAAYIAGVADEMRQIGLIVSALPAGTSITAIRDFAFKGICGDYAATNDDEVEAFKDWARPNLKYWAEPAYAGVETALTSTWPCRVPK